MKQKSAAIAVSAIDYSTRQADPARSGLCMGHLSLSRDFSVIQSATMSVTATMQSNDTVWPVVGHGWAVALLQRAVPSPRHAYLITGPRHVGKTTLAQAFAQTLLCAQGGVAPCGSCRACRLMTAGAHPDFRLVQPVDKEGEVDRARGLIRVEHANELVRAVAMRPMEGRYKIFLIQDVHAANDNFANKILKTLEEPSAHVILLLTADDRVNVLPTIVSRCQVLPLRPLDLTTVRAALTSTWQLDAARADLLARLSTGRLGWAVQEADDAQFLATRTTSLERLQELTRSDRIDRLAFAEELAARRTHTALFELLELWTSWWRDVMLVQSGCADACTNVDYLDAVQAHARRFPRTEVRAYLALLQQIDGYLHHTVNPRLALDVLLLRLPHERRRAA